VGTTSGNYTSETPSQAKTATGAFYADVINLNPGTTYYYRSKAAGHGTSYGTEKSFTTLKEAPTVSTLDATNLTLSSARLNGELSALGTAPSGVSVKFWWGTAPESLTTDTVPAVALSAPANFYFDLTGLSQNTTYYYKAEAAGIGTSYVSYGEEKSFTTRTNVAVDISVVLQGGGRPTTPASPSSGWVVPLVVKFFTPGANVTADTPLYTFNPTTAQAGTSPNYSAVAQCTNVMTGTYDITAVSPHTFLNVKRNVAISPSSTSVSLGTLLEGNANDNNVINITDFGILAVSYSKLQGDTGFDPRADFDRNGRVNITDFGLLAINYLKLSPIVVP
ncbi:MAG: hypothetical protein Q8O16_00100, partial [Dehalococcoidia bacterium]|nr:hypothetical protein [Dehalococcoidia bacterium]